MRGEKKTLTHTFLLSLKAKPIIYEIFDTEVPGLGVRVSPKGKKTFFLLARFRGPESNPARRALGHFDSTALIEQEHKNKKVNVSLADAREKARDWKKSIEKGLDPKIERKKEAASNVRKAQATFSAVAEMFIAEWLPNIRRRNTFENDIRKRFIEQAGWGDRPISDITHEEIVSFVRDLAKRGKKAQARVCLSELRTFFEWAVAADAFGIKESPVDGFKSKTILGKRVSRKRILDENEIRAFWATCETLPYPWGEVHLLLLLTGQRLREIACASWKEVDLVAHTLTIPPERMKTGDDPHVCPLPPRALSIFENLPRFNGGDFCFSNNHGAKPVAAYSYAKRMIDKQMSKELIKITGSSEIESWTVHDLRRTARSGLSEIGIHVAVAEKVIAHQLTGLLGIYDRSDYEERKMEALTAWEKKLQSIIDPQPGNIVQLRA